VYPLRNADAAARSGSGLEKKVPRTTKMRTGLSLLQNKALRKTRRSNGDELTEDWRNYTSRNFRIYSLHLISLYVIKPRRIKWAGYTALMREMRNAHKILLWKSQRKKPLRRPNRRSEDGI
jgi:hypothetical protein